MKVTILNLRGVLLTSLHTELSDKDMLEFQGDLLKQASGHHVKGAIIDITLLDIVDTFMARSINETATMLSLLGKKAIICGMHPSVSLTLIEMGREILDVQTSLNLNQAIGKMEELIAHDRS